MLLFNKRVYSMNYMILRWRENVIPLLSFWICLSVSICSAMHSPFVCFFYCYYNSLQAGRLFNNCVHCRYCLKWELDRLFFFVFCGTLAPACILTVGLLSWKHAYYYVGHNAIQYFIPSAQMRPIWEWSFVCADEHALCTVCHFHIFNLAAIEHSAARVSLSGGRTAAEGKFLLYWLRHRPADISATGISGD